MKVVIDGIEYVPAPPVAQGEKLEEALEVRFDSDAGDNLTIREFFRVLLSTLWEEEGDFSGKRPFGNSGWQYAPVKALAKAGFVDLGEYDEEDDDFSYATSSQWKDGERYVANLILKAFEKP